MRLHATEAVKAGMDVYCEKPFAETMEDNRNALKVIKASNRICTIDSQRRNGPNYKAAADFIQAGKFGPITMVELTWNVNQTGSWRRPDLVAKCKEEDLDWNRFLEIALMLILIPRKYLQILFVDFGLILQECQDNG
jgi:hypothetical protein